MSLLNRHCEPTGRANARPMTGSAEAIQKPLRRSGLLRRFSAKLLSDFVAAPRNDASVSTLPSKGDRNLNAWRLRAICGLMHRSKLCLFDHLVSNGEHCRRDGEAKRSRGFDIDHQLEFGRLHDRQVGRPRPLEDPVYEIGGAPKITG